MSAARWGAESPAEGCRQHFLMSVFDLLPSDLGGPLARRGMQHDQEAFQRRVRSVGDVDERGRDGFSKVG